MSSSDMEDDLILNVFENESCVTHKRRDRKKNAKLIYLNKNLNTEMFSLQSLCLDSIVENFCRFHFAFTTSKDASLQRNLKFIQRRYSDYFAGKLLKENDQTIDKYFEFVINEHISSVDFDWFQKSHYLDSIDNIFSRLPNLRSIYFEFCGDEILESIGKFCPNIVEITVEDPSVTDKGVKSVCKLKNGKVPCRKLKNISICDSLITDIGVEYLVRCLPRLEKLKCDNLPLVLYSIHKRNLSESRKLHSYSLIELDLTGYEYLPNYADILKICLSVCPNLESVDCQISEKAHLDAFNCSHLTKLDLDCAGEDLINIDNFLKINGRNLTSLSITNCTVSASVLAEQCPALEVLEVYDVYFIDEGDPQLIFPSLTQCDFINYSDDKAFRILSSSSPKLESVGFESCTSFFELQKQILIWVGNSAVKDISFLNIPVEINFLRDILLNCRSLKIMILIDCNYDHRNPENFLKVLAETLPNKPEIYYCSF